VTGGAQDHQILLGIILAIMIEMGHLQNALYTESAISTYRGICIKGNLAIVNRHDILIHSLMKDMKISDPKIAVLGLNPHAGENGIIGKEEENIIFPAIKSYPKNNLLTGPFSPDAFFANQLYKNYDLVLGMYHDQVLIPFKMINFGKGVNFTAGLPIIRTSPDHGVAYDIAEKNIADASSMIEAFKYAKKITANRFKNAKS